MNKLEQAVTLSSCHQGLCHSPEPSLLRGTEPPLNWESKGIFPPLNRQLFGSRRRKITNADTNHLFIAIISKQKYLLCSFKSSKKKLPCEWWLQDTGYSRSVFWPSSYLCPHSSHILTIGGSHFSALGQQDVSKCKQKLEMCLCGRYAPWDPWYHP